MKNYFSILIISIAVLITSASCKKTVNEVEILSVNCKIDGRVWTSYSDDFKLSAAKCRISNNGEEVFITATNTRLSEKIGITIATPGQKVVEGKYKLNIDNYLTGRYYLFDVGYFVTGQGYQGEVEIISIDKIKSRITGKFHYSCYNERSKKSVEITEGNFNIPYTVH